MTVSINFTIENFEGEEIFRKESTRFNSVPNIGDKVSLSLLDYSFSNELYEESKLKGAIRVADIEHVYYEKELTHSINVTLAFSSDKRFGDRFWT